MQVQGELNGDVLTLRIDCSAEARARAEDSKSGKTRILATTRGFAKVKDISYSVNVTIPKDTPA